MGDQVVYTSYVLIERIKGPYRRAHLPATEDPIHLGVHSEIAEYYKVSSDVSEPRATTLDYVIAAVGG